MADLNFADRLGEAVERKRTQLVVGLDPRVDLLPVELRGEAVLGRAAAASAVARFCKGIIDAVGPYVVAVKPQCAFFEELGADGVRALEEVCDYARSVGVLVLVDAKRGDIASTARAYAAAFLEPREGGAPLADAVTASPYLGHDASEPFIAACRRHGAGVFFLVRTSNAGATEVQDVTLSDGRMLWQYLAELVHEWGQPLVGERGISSVGRGRRRDPSARGLAGAEAHAADAAPAPGRRRPGRDAGRRRAGVHERACERARHRIALRHLRLQELRGGLADCRRLGGGAPLDTGVGRRGLEVAAPRIRRGAPVECAAGEDACAASGGAPRTDFSCSLPRRRSLLDGGLDGARARRGLAARASRGRLVSRERGR